MGSMNWCISPYAVLIFLLCMSKTSFLHYVSPLAAAAAAISKKIGGNETDLLALLAIKEQIYYDPTLITSMWNDSLHFCQWQGVSCGHRHQRVRVLNLTSSRLVGSVSPSIGNLSFLRILDLSNNSFSGKLPREVGLLSRLQAIYLTNNTFEGEIPTNLSNCSNLEILRLFGNKLAGKVPASLGSLTKLVVLDLSANNLTGAVSPFLGNLSFIEFLAANENKLEGSIPGSLGHLKRLKTLAFSTNNLTGIIPPSIYNLSSLTRFTVFSNQLQGNLPQNLGLATPKLQFFLVSENQFTGTIPVSISNASNVAFLELASNQFFNGVQVDFSKLQKLQWLNLQANRLGSGEANDVDFISSLTNCSKLRVLPLDANNFGGILPNSTANLSMELQYFTADANEISGSIPAGIENLVSLNFLSLQHNQLSGHIPASICKLHMLQLLSFDKNKLSGKIPSCIGNLTLLNKLWLGQNNLEGTIPSSFGNCQSLLFLHLYSNNLTGGIPRELLTLSSLSISLNLAHSSLSGPIPLEEGNLTNLVELNVSHNKLSGNIPSSLSSLSNLARLYMDHNSFQGAIPQSFGLLRGLEDVDLSANNLSGEIPKSLGTLRFLINLNLSFNDLEGEVPAEGLVFKNATAISIYGNSKLCGGISVLHLPMCSKRKPTRRGISHVQKLIIGLACGLLGVILVSSLLVIGRIRKLRKKLPSTSPLLDPLKTISYGELLKATNGFYTANLIGVGSFGSVYKGILDQDETAIAVKVLNLQNRRSSKSSIAECKVLRNTRHRNLVKIVTCCSSTDFQGNDFKALVFEFMPNGSLDTWLHPVLPQTGVVNVEPKSLNLLQRINIAIDVASALDYLHNHCHIPIIHCDLKPSNILLDGDLTAHVSDFGLARFLKQQGSEISQSHSSSLGIKGTVGYIPPEYGMGSEVSAEGDAYSYGILLLEMFTGKRPTDGMFHDGLSLDKLAEMALSEDVMQIADKVLLFGVEEGEATSSSSTAQATRELIQRCLILIFRIGVACSVESPKERMNIVDAHKELLLIKGMLV